MLCLAAINLAWIETAEPSEEDFFGGPTSIGAELQLDDEPPAIRGLEAWFSFKKELRERRKRGRWFQNNLKIFFYLRQLS